MDLETIHQIAISNKNYADFKAQIDKHFNGTPVTAVDNTKYKLVKNNLELGSVVGRSEQLCHHEYENNLGWIECRKCGYIKHVP